MLRLSAIYGNLIFLSIFLLRIAPSFGSEHFDANYDSSNITAQIADMQKEVSEKFFEDEWKLFLNHIKAEECIELKKPFNPNSYFTILKHLSMEENWVLDYVYWFGGGGGRPYLYARKKSDKEFANLSEFKKHVIGDKTPKKIMERESNTQDLELCDFEKEFMERIKADGSRESYFELAVIYEIAAQFYLFWHCLYNDTQIITTSKDVERVINDHDIKNLNPVQPFSDKEIAEIRWIDPKPMVNFVDESLVEVSIVTFTNWGGFNKNTYRIQRSYPHKIIKSESRTIIEYYCGTCF